VLDRDAVARHDDPLHQQAHEPLPTSKVQAVQSGPQRRREGREILRQPLESPAVHVLRPEFREPSLHRLLGSLQSFPPRLELFDAHRSGLVGIDQPLDLPVQTSLGARRRARSR
jgi:hypothetical protein